MSHENPWAAPHGPQPAWPPPRRFHAGYAALFVLCLLGLGVHLAAQLDHIRSTEPALAIVVPITGADGREVRADERVPGWIGSLLVTLRFETRDGRLVEARNYHINSWPTDGARIPIRYDPRNPEAGVVQQDALGLVLQPLCVLGLAWLLLPAFGRAMRGKPLRFWPLWPWRP
jgi:hypothetical protein